MFGALHSEITPSYLLNNSLVYEKTMNCRADLERKWHARVQAARHRYVESKRVFERVVVESGGALIPSEGGKLSQARLSEQCAFDEYDRTLRIYTDLVLYCKVPAGPES